MGVLHIGGGDAVADCLGQDGLVVDAGSVVGDLDDDLASGVLGGEQDLAHGVFSGGDAVLHVFLDAVVHGVADHVHDGVSDGVHDGLVHLGVLAHQGELHLLVQLFAHIPDDAVHLLEGVGHRNHPQGHGHVLQLVRKLAQLPGGLGEGVQMQALQVRRAGDHGLGNDDLAHDGGELVQLAQAHADEALLLALALGVLLGGAGLGRRSGGRLLGGGSGLGGSGGGLRRRGRGGYIILLLVGVDGAGGHDDGHGPGPVLLAAELEEEAVLDHHLGQGGVALHAGGLVGKVRFGAEALNGGDQHEGPEVLHAAALVKEDPEAEGELGAALRGLGGDGGGGSRLRRRGGSRRRRGSGLGWNFFPLNFGDQTINISKETVDIFIKRLFCLHLLHFLPEIVYRVEHNVEERRTVLVLHHGHGALPNEEEHVLDAVGDPGQRIELHHGGRALDGMHDAEDFIDVVLRECIFLFRVQNDALQLLKKRIGFVDVHIQDIIVAHENTTLSAFFITIDLLR